MPELPDVRPGQVWRDNDPRSGGRLIRVRSLHPADDSHREPYVRVTVEKVGRNVAKREAGEQRTIQQRRFRPTRNGYRLVEDVAPVGPVDPYPKEEALGEEVADRLTDAAGRVRLQGWTQDETHGNREGPVTLLGALLWAFSDFYGHTSGWEETPVFAKAFEVLHAQLPDDVEASQAGLTAWNHAEGRTIVDVLDVLQRAARVARA